MVTCTVSPGFLSRIADQQVAGLDHVLVVDLDDDVALLDAGLGRRARRA